MTRTDPLIVLNSARRARIDVKRHDFASEWLDAHPGRTFPPKTTAALSLADGKPITLESAADYNARERRFCLSHVIEPRYLEARRRAMRPVRLPGAAA